MKEETTIKWYTGDEIPKLNSTILLEFKDVCFASFNSINVVYGAGYFHAPEPRLEENLYYHLRMCDGEFIEFESKEEFTSIIKRWCYLE